MKHWIFSVMAGAWMLAGNSCTETQPSEALLLPGDWHVVDFKATDDKAETAALIMVALTGSFPDQFHFTADSVYLHMSGKDTVWEERMAYVQDRDSVRLTNAEGTPESLGTVWQGDTLVLSGSGYQYYLKR